MQEINLRNRMQISLRPLVDSLAKFSRAILVKRCAYGGIHGYLGPAKLTRDEYK